MISRRAFLLSATLPLLARPSLGFSQEVCAAKDDVVLLADYVIANRSKLSKLQNRRNGAISAYLKIMYQGLAPEQVEALVEPLASGKVDRARELLVSWRISTYGLEEALTNTAPEGEKDVFEPGAGFSPLRAAIRSGEIPYFFDKLAAIPPEGRHNLELRVAQSVIDVDEESKKALESEALARKLNVLAASFAAMQDDPNAWNAFVAALNDKAEADRLTTMLYWLPALRGSQ